MTLKNKHNVTLRGVHCVDTPLELPPYAKKLKRTVTSLLVLYFVFLFTPELQARDAALWLARSCVGEANFDSAETGECAALLHVYAKRARLARVTIYTAVRKYSAAVKPRKTHPRPWVLQLDRNGTKPKKWPGQKKKWSSVESMWFDVLWLCDDFLKGKIANPVPNADHYGSKIDEWRAVQQRWRKLKVPHNFKNQFWNINVKRKRN